MTQQAAIFANDLFFVSQLQGSAKRADCELTMANSLDRLESLAQELPLSTIVVDLAHPEAAAIEEFVAKLRSLVTTPVRIIGYAQHVQVERLKKAREAGCDHVTSRGDIARSLPQLLS